MKTLNIAAFDLGGSGGKVQLGSYDGRTLRQREILRFKNGTISIHKDQYWDFFGICHAFAQGLGKAAAECHGALSAVGATTFGHNIVLFDRAGRPYTPPYAVYPQRMDSAMAAVRAQISPLQLHLRTGAEFRNYLTLVQLRAYDTNGERDILRNAGKALLWSDALNYAYSGDMQSEWSAASVGALVQRGEMSWSSDLAALAGVDVDQLAPIVEPCTIQGDVIGAARRRLGLSTGIQVVNAPGHDTASAVFSLPTQETEAAFVSLGTMGLVGWETAQPIISEYTYANALGNYALPFGRNMLMTSTRCLWHLEKCREYPLAGWGTLSFADMAEMAQAERPMRFIIDLNDDDYLADPADVPRKIAAYCQRSGQGEMSTAGECFRCIFDSVALSVSRSFQVLAAAVGRLPKRIHVLGGGGKNAFLMQLLADCCQAEIVVPLYEATSYGVLLAELIALKEIDGLAQARALAAASLPVRIYTPNETVDLESVLPHAQRVAWQRVPEGESG